jgi:disulfide bond formation protein DsbB
LQRAGFVVAGFGLALNLRFGPRASHYAIMIIGALAGATIAGRQILIHIVPGTGAYGSALLGLHFYTWAFVVFALIVLGTAVMLLFDRQFASGEGAVHRLTGLSLVAFALFALLALGNGVSTILECAAGCVPTTRPTICCCIEDDARGPARAEIRGAPTRPGFS